EGDAARAEVAVVGEGLAGRVEDLDAAPGGNEDPVIPRLDRQALSEAVAKSTEDRASLGVELDQWASAGGRPEMARIIHRHVVNRERLGREGGAHLAALGGDREELVPSGTAAYKRRAVGEDDDGHRADVRPALADAGRIGSPRKWLDNVLELRRPGTGG